MTRRRLVASQRRRRAAARCARPPVAGASRASRPAWLVGGAIVRPSAGGSDPAASGARPAVAERRRVGRRPARRASRAPLPAGETRTVTIETDEGRRSSSRSRRTCRRSPPATSSPSPRAASTTASSSTGVVPGTSSSRAATRPAPARGGPGYTIKDEPVTATYGRGTVAMARTARAELGRLAVLHRPRRQGAATSLADYNTYQIIGNVTSGMETSTRSAAAGGAETAGQPGRR